MNFDSFNPTTVAKEVIGELTDSIRATHRDAGVSEPQGRQTFNSALLLQAGLRALLPVSERQGVALPKIFPKDPPALQAAQRNYAEVFASAQEATPEQRAAGLNAVLLAARELADQGYERLADAINRFLVSQTSPPSAPRPPGPALQ